MKKKRISVNTFVVMLLGSVCFTAGGVQAIDGTDNGSNEYTLNPVVVTATKSEQQWMQVPQDVQVVSEKDIKERNIKTVAEAIQYLPGVYMNQKAVGDVQIRGFEGSNVLVMLDGVAVNNTYDGTTNWAMLPIGTVKKIELVKGAGSSLWGGHAIGAVINITTQDASPTQKGHANISGRLGYGSHNTWNRELMINGRINDRVTAGISYAKRSTSGYPGYYYTAKASKGKGTIALDSKIPQTSDGKYILGGRGKKEWTTENIGAWVKYQIDANKNIKYNYQHMDYNYRYKDPFSYAISDGKEIFSGKLRVDSTHVVNSQISTYLGYDGQTASDMHRLSYSDTKNKIRASLGYVDTYANGFSSADKKATTISWDRAGEFSSYPGKAYDADINKVWDIGKHSLTVGVNYRQESFDQERSTLLHWRDHDSQNTNVGKDGVFAEFGGKSRNTALYVQDEYDINDVWTVYAGARWDYYKKLDGYAHYYDNKHKSSDFEGASFSEISPKVAVQYNIDDTSSIYASYGHSFNPPTLYKVYRYGGGGMGDVIPNPGLKPETSDTFELGYKKIIGNKTALTATYFNARTDDTIQYVTHYDAVDTTKTLFKRYENVGKSKKNGIELAAQHAFNDNWSGYLNYTWQEAKITGKSIANTNFTDEDTVRDYTVPKHILHSGVQYKVGKLATVLDMQYISDRQAPDKVTGEYGSEDSYVLFNMAMNYKVNESLGIQFAINNMFDRQFYNSEATDGRSYHLNLDFKF